MIIYGPSIEEPRFILLNRYLLLLFLQSIYRKKKKYNKIKKLMNGVAVRQVFAMIVLLQRKM